MVKGLGVNLVKGVVLPERGTHLIEYGLIHGDVPVRPSDVLDESFLQSLSTQQVPFRARLLTGGRQGGREVYGLLWVQDCRVLLRGILAAARGVRVDCYPCKWVSWRIGEYPLTFPSFAIPKWRSLTDFETFPGKSSCCMEDAKVCSVACSPIGWPWACICAR
jgi:hypothetical protein